MHASDVQRQGDFQLICVGSHKMQPYLSNANIYMTLQALQDSKNSMFGAAHLSKRFESKSPPTAELCEDVSFHVHFHF